MDPLREYISFDQLRNFIFSVLGVGWAFLVVGKYALFNGPNTDRSQTERIQNQFNWKTFFPPGFLFRFRRVDFSFCVFLFCGKSAMSSPLFLSAKKSLWELTKFSRNCVHFRFRLEMNDFRDAFKTLMRRNVMAVTGMNPISQWTTRGSSLQSHQVGQLIARDAPADNRSRLSKTLLHTSWQPDIV